MLIYSNSNAIIYRTPSCLSSAALRALIFGCSLSPRALFLLLPSCCLINSLYRRKPGQSNRAIQLLNLLPLKEEILHGNRSRG